VQSPSVPVCVVPVSLPSVVPPLVPVDDVSPPDELELVEVVEVEVDVSTLVVDDAVSELVGVVVIPCVLDIESVPGADPLIDSPVLAPPVSAPRSSPLQAKRVRPTSVASTTGAGP